MAGFNSTLGGSEATSYISIDEADSLLINTRYNTAWQSNTEAQKSEYLVSATFWLDQLSYAGTRCSPSTDNPALPQGVVMAKVRRQLVTASRPPVHSSPIRSSQPPQFWRLNFQLIPTQLTDLSVVAAVVPLHGTFTKRQNSAISS